MKELKVLELIGNTASTKDKEKILVENQSDVLMRILLYTYNPYWTYNVKKLDFPDKFNYLQPDVSDELFGILDLLSCRKIKPNEGRALLKKLMAKCTEEGANWVAKIVNRDLKIGVSASTVNKAFPDLVPCFSPMLCNPVVEPKEGKEHWDKVNFPVEGTEKMDGHRSLVVCHAGAVGFLSRKGLPVETLDFLAPQILKLANGRDVVFDCEVIGLNYVPTCEVSKKNYEAGKNWRFAQGGSMVTTKPGKYSAEEMAAGLGLKIFDVVDTEYFMSRGKRGICKPLKYRKTQLAGMFERLEKPLPNVERIASRILNNRAEAVAWFREIIAAGGEGLILAALEGMYEFKRSYGRMKMKEFYTADLRVTGCEEGKKGTKNEGSLGAIEVSDGTVTGKLMGGWDDEEGLSIWFRYKRGEFVGSIVECIYMEVTADNSLRHGVFVRERPDKDEISWG